MQYMAFNNQSAIATQTAAGLYEAIAKGDHVYPPKPKQWIPFPETYGTMMDYKTPIITALIYSTCVHLINKTRGRGPAPRFTHSLWFKALVLAHNAFLCVYSVWTFIHGFRQVSAQFGAGLATGQFGKAFCDQFPLQDNLVDNLINYYGYLFYLSKFYEIFDTIIILVKNKKSSLLQTYHHSGAMITMWAGIRYQAPPIWIFIVFNSFIHSIMYFYYTVSTLRLPFPRVLKRSLTTLQITQFLVGGSTAASYLFVDSCLKAPGQVWAVILNVAYLAPLTYLFCQFFIASYLKGPSSKASTKQAKKINESIKAQ